MSDDWVTLIDNAHCCKRILKLSATFSSKVWGMRCISSRTACFRSSRFLGWRLHTFKCLKCLQVNPEFEPGYTSDGPVGVPTVQMSPGCSQITSRFRDCAVSNVINSQRWGYRHSRLEREREEVEATLGPYKPVEGKLLHTQCFPIITSH